MNRFSRHFILGIAAFAAGSAMAGVTFYESENFGGRQISGTQSMPNFRALDFNDRARSAIVEGGPWEVCVGTKFDNDCTIMQPGRYSNLGEWSKRISSARPVSQPASYPSAPAMMPAPVGTVTFYEAENFGGRRIAADWSQPNFGTLGFDRRAHSAIIEGGSWEVCADHDFRGGCTILAPGRYPILDAWAGRISSVRPASMPMAEMWPPAVAMRSTGGIVFFESENFVGRQFMIDQPDPNFGRSHASDRAQSAIVEGGAWELCGDADFRGGCQILVPGRYPELGGLGGRISSARPSYDRRGEVPRDGMRGSASATLYSGPNLTGRAFALGGAGPGNLDVTFNDRASSLRVDRGYWIFCSDANMRGECRTFGPGNYAQLSPELDNRISSGRRISNEYPYRDNPNWR